MDTPFFSRGKTFYDGGTVDTTAGIFDHVLGKEYEVVDRDAGGRDSATPSGLPVTLIAVRNDSGSAISNAAGLGVVFGTDAKDHLRLSDGLPSVTGQFGLPVDSFLPTTWDIADDDVFWVVKEGPAEMLLSGSIAVDDLVCLEASTGKALKYTGKGVPIGVAYESGTDGDRIVVLVGEEYMSGSRGELAGATFSIGSEAGDAIIVSIQLKDAFNRDLTHRAAVHAFLSTDSNGDNHSTAGGSLAITSGTDGHIVETSTDNGFLLVSEADGDIDVTITDSTGAVTHYLFLVMPNGNLVSSGAITFAA